ncbi:MAG: hypothetical protein LBG76_03215 [Treponema sp.]|jgi:hypothetical protein|nr:hypothetical protein [Treponema sp.]
MRRSIGVEKESSLHQALKIRYTGSEERTEAQVAGFVCDGLRETGEMIEVQTGSFGPLREKAARLCALGPLRIIHPIAISKIIELYDTAGVLLSRRKSPKRGSIWDLFKVLLYAPELPLLPSLTIELALVDTLEKRVQDGRGSWRRRGVSIGDKSLVAYHSTLPFRCLKDYHCFIPFSEKEEFTSQELGNRAHIKPDLARKTLYVLTKLGIVERRRRNGHAWIYRQISEGSD